MFLPSLRCILWLKCLTALLEVWEHWKCLSSLHATLPLKEYDIREERMDPSRCRVLVFVSQQSILCPRSFETVGLSDWLCSEGLPAQLTHSAKQQEAATTGLMCDMPCRLPAPVVMATVLLLFLMILSLFASCVMFSFCSSYYLFYCEGSLLFHYTSCLCSFPSVVIGCPALISSLMNRPVVVYLSPLSVPLCPQSLCLTFSLHK